MSNPSIQGMDLASTVTITATALKASGIMKKPLVITKAKIVAFLTDWQVFVPGLFLAGYIVGIITASHIRNPDSIAYVHQGPYAFVGIYKKKLYELIPMEESVRLHQLQRTKEKPDIQKNR